MITICRAHHIRIHFCHTAYIDENNFQSLENLVLSFPDVGNFSSWFSNGWKNLIAIFQPLEVFGCCFPTVGNF